MATPITRDEAVDRVQSGAVFIEVLPESYHRESHLPGAINIPLDQIDELAPNLLGDLESEIVVYCSDRACQNSTVAARRLTELGYTNVYEYEDGKADWIAAGLATESGTEVAR